MKRLFYPAVIAFVMTLQAPAIADAPVQGTMQAFIVKQVKGEEVLKAADNVEPDEIVEYRLTYVNKSRQGVSGLTVTGPVPEGTTYVTDTAITETAANFLVSIDGGTTFEKEPVIREVVSDNGEVIEKVIPVDQYTHVQWHAQGELTAKGGTQLYRYRVRVK